MQFSTRLLQLQLNICILIGNIQQISFSTVKFLSALSQKRITNIYVLTQARCRELLLGHLRFLRVQVQNQLCSFFCILNTGVRIAITMYSYIKHGSCLSSNTKNTHISLILHIKIMHNTF